MMSSNWKSWDPEITQWLLALMNKANHKIEDHQYKEKILLSQHANPGLCAYFTLSNSCI